MRPAAANLGNVTLFPTRVTCPIFTAATSLIVLSTAAVTCRRRTEWFGFGRRKGENWSVCRGRLL